MPAEGEVRTMAVSGESGVSEFIVAVFEEDEEGEWRGTERRKKAEDTR